MGKFPERQIDIVELAESIVQGLTNNPLVYPNPPVPPGNLMTVLLELIQANDEVVAVQAEAEQKTQTKNEKLAVLVGQMKNDLMYAENTVNFDDDLLKLLGWSGRAEPKPLMKPGQCDNFSATAEGSDWIEFAWDAPIKGGKPAMYKIMHRDYGSPKWKVAENAYETTFRLEGVEAGKKMDYCVVASNKAGQSGESNIVTAVL